MNKHTTIKKYFGSLILPLVVVGCFGFIGNVNAQSSFDQENARIDAEIARIQAEIDAIDPRIEDIRDELEDNNIKWQEYYFCFDPEVSVLSWKFVEGLFKCPINKFQKKFGSENEANYDAWFGAGSFLQNKEKERTELEQKAENLRIEQNIKYSQIACLNKERPGLTAEQSQSYSSQCEESKEAVETHKQQSATKIQASIQDERMRALNSCSILKLNNCVYQVMAGFLQLISAMSASFMAGSNAFFGLMLSLSISDFHLYANSAAVMGTWSVIRDICNLFFIFILLYIAFQTIIGYKEADAKKLLMKVIVVALLINFSAILPKLAIDISNIFSLFFYNNLKVINGDSTTALIGAIDFRSIQYGMDTHIVGSIAGLWGTIIVSSFGMIIMTMITTLIFLVGGLMLVYRMIVLLLLIIASPLFVISFILPSKQAEKIQSQWQNNLISLSLYLPLMLIMLWITSKLILGTGGLAGMLTGSVGAADSISRTIIMFLIVNALLMTSMGMAWKMGSIAATTSVGIVAGTAGLIGRNTVGRAASRLAQSKRFNELAGKSRLAEYALRGTRGVGSNTFDLRNSSRLNKLSSYTDDVKLGTGTTQGGYEEGLRRNISERETFGTSLKTPEARKSFAGRTAKSPMARFGSMGRPGSKKRSILSMFGRSNRIAAAQMIQNQINELTNNINQMNARLARLDAVPGSPGTLTVEQQAERNALIAGEGAPGAIATLASQRATLQAEIPRLGLDTTIVDQY